MVLCVAGRKKQLSEKRPCANVVSVTNSAGLSDATSMSIEPSGFAVVAIVVVSVVAGGTMALGGASCTMCSDTTAPWASVTVAMSTVWVPLGSVLLGGVNHCIVEGPGSISTGCECHTFPSPAPASAYVRSTTVPGSACHVSSVSHIMLPYFHTPFYLIEY
eukprot:m.922954 g.922954  ORF g.922954 m.922954 type:complete len:161 (+) comp23763_c0_seq2:458-940(+)